MTARPPEADVLICGLGPVGQLLAHLLGARGVRTLAVDAAPGPNDLPRAAVIDDEVLRILQSVGLGRAVLADAQIQRRVSYVTAGGRPIAVLHAEDGRLGHPPLVSIHQPSLERTLLRNLGDHSSVRVLWGQRLERLDQEAGQVLAHLRPVGAGEPRVVSARWAVACDGAASPIRAALGIPFGGSTSPERWLVVDAEVDRPLARVPHPYFVGDRERPIVTLPMSPGRHRWEWMIRPGEDAAAFLDPVAIERRVARWLDGERARTERAVIYAFHARTAARWRAGRILLAGDAAHVMPPFAGQGFASGARDAANLAWKLDAVLRGAPDGLLDSYEAERRPHVAAMQQLATRWGGVVQTTRPRLARGRDRLLSALDDSAAGDWLRQHAKPLPTYRAGAFSQRPHPLPFRRGTGSLFPQPEVLAGGPGGGARLLDELLPDGWAVLARRSAASGTRRASDPPVLRLGEEIEDVTGIIDGWLDRHRADWVLLRPDRFVYASGREPGLPSALAAMRALLGTA